MTTPAYEPGSAFSNQTGFQRFLFLLWTLCLLLFTLSALGFTLFSITRLALDGQFDFSFLCIILFLLIFGVTFFALMHRMVLWFFTSYRFEHDGLRIIYPLQQSKLIPWNDFQKVGIYFSDNHPYHLTKHHNISLCCIHKRAKKNLYGHWPLAQTNKVFNMHYSPELYAGLCEMCTIPVTDLRPEYPSLTVKDLWR